MTPDQTDSTSGVDPDELALALAAIRAARGGRADRTPQSTVRALWRTWETWAAANRADWRKIKAHRARVLDTPICLEGGETSLGDLPWPACDAAAADAWRIAMRVSLTKHGHHHYAPGTRNSMLATLRGMLRWHFKRGHISRHPLAGLDLEPENERSGYFTDEQLETFAAYLPNPYRLIMRVSYRCGGLRNREVRELRKCEIDRERRLIVIPASRTKNRRLKVTPITDDVWSDLEHQMDAAPGDFVFPSHRVPGRPISPSGWQWQMEQARKRSGVLLMGERPVLHHARHGYAVASLAKGASTAAIMSTMGHESMRAARRYQRLAGPALEQMRELMNRRTPGAEGGSR